MILLNSDILVRAYDTTDDLQAKAAAYIEELFNTRQVFLNWQIIIGFLENVTDPVKCLNPLPITEATEIVGNWLELQNVHLIEPGDRQWSLFRQVLIEGKCSGSFVTGAYLTALAKSLGATVATADRDYQRLNDLATIVNPLTK